MFLFNSITPVTGAHTQTHIQTVCVRVCMWRWMVVSGVCLLVNFPSGWVWSLGDLFPHRASCCAGSPRRLAPRTARSWATRSVTARARGKARRRRSRGTPIYTCSSTVKKTHKSNYIAANVNHIETHTQSRLYADWLLLSGFYVACTPILRSSSIAWLAALSFEHLSGTAWCLYNLGAPRSVWGALSDWGLWLCAAGCVLVELSLTLSNSSRY